MSDMFTSLAAQHGPDYVVTEDDVKACTAKLRRG